MGLHRNITATDMHVVQSYTYADEAERLAAVGFVAADIGRIALVQATNKFWALINHAPITWVDMLSSGAPGGNEGEVQFNASGIFTGDSNLVFDPAQAALKIGPALLLPDNPLAVAANIDSPVQINVQNLSDGTSASSDLVATADTGDNNTGYVDVGINSSTYSDSDYDIGGPLDAYLQAQGGDLTVGTGAATKTVKLHTGGTKAENLRTTVDDAGLNLAPGHSLRIGGVLQMPNRVVRAVSTAPQLLSGLEVVGGLATVDGDRVLVKDQVTASDNGVYIVRATAWELAPDWATGLVEQQARIVCENGYQTWAVDTANPITVGTTDVTFVRAEVASAIRTGGIVALDQTAPTAGLFLRATGANTAAWGTAVPSISQRLTVGMGGDVNYTSIKAAVDAAIAAGASPTNGYEIHVYPGTYAEAPFTMQQGVVVTSDSQRVDAAFVTASDPNEDLITMTGGYICGLNLQGVSDATKCLIRCATASSLSVLHGISFQKCSQGVIASNGATVIVTNPSVTIDGINQSITTAWTATGSGTYLAFSGGFASVPAAVLPAYASNPIQTVYRAASGARIVISGATHSVAPKDNTADVLLADGGSTALVLSSEFNGCGTAIHVGSGGSGTSVSTMATVMTNNYRNANVESATGRVLGVVSVDTPNFEYVAGAVVGGIVNNIGSGELDVVGPFHYLFPDGNNLDLKDYFYDFSMTGVCDGGGVTVNAGLVVDIEAGEAFFRDPINESASTKSWTADSLTLINNATNFIYYDSVTELLVRDTTFPNRDSTALLATAVAQGGVIRFLHNTIVRVDDYQGKLNDYLVATRKFALKSGLACVQGTTVTKIDIGSGTYYRALEAITCAGSSGDATFSYFYGSNGATEVASQTDLSTTSYDNAGTLTAMSSGYFRTDTVFITSDNRISVVYGTAEYATSDLALAAPDANVPTFMEETACILANIVVEEGAGINEIVDRRPNLALSTGGGAGGVAVHSALAGLAADDHTQYLLASGTRSMAGALNMGGQNITNVGTVDGVDVSTHAARHNPGGIDELAAAAPAALAVVVGGTADIGSAASYALSDHIHTVTRGTPQTVGTANAAGTAATFAGSDHVHDHGNQTTATHHAVVTITDNGFMSSGDKIKLNSVATDATNTPLASAAPADVTKAAAVVGVATDAARADHKHNVSTAVVGSVGTANSEGTATSLARSDHVHNHGAQTVGTLHAAATTGTAGFLSTVDKTKLDSLFINLFGTENQETSNTTLASTTSGTYQTYLTLNTTNLPAGKYRIGWNYAWAFASTAQNFQARIVLDGATTLLQHIEEPQDTGAAQRRISCGFQYVTFGTSATHTVALTYSSSGGATAYMAFGKIELWRVS